MTDSPYSTDAARYREQGLSVIPCAAGTKFPGTYTAAHGWRAAYDWQKYCDRLPTDFEATIWERWPDAGICLALGAASGRNGLHLVALDIDTDEPAEVAAIKSVLPGSPVAKKGAKGETQFYLASEKVKSRPFNDADKRRMLDLLCTGRQTVMPPTWHPDCKACGARDAVIASTCGTCGAEGQAYRWITLDTLESFDLDDLPVLPDDIADRLSEALKPFGYQPPELAQPGTASLGIESPHRSLNDAALANLDAWVPALALHGCARAGQGYKAVAHWRPSSSGRPLPKRQANLRISHDGIRDFGDDRGYTPIDLVMAACGADLDTAFEWLQVRVAPSKPIELRASAPAPVAAEPEEEEERWRPVRKSARGNLRLAFADGEMKIPAEEAEAIAAAVPLRPSSILHPDLCTPPGLLGEMVEWMNATASRPLPQLNLGAAICFLGALTGRRFESPTRARTNFYAVGLAPTGSGKNHPLVAMNELAAHAGVPHFVGPESLKSESSIRKLLEAKNTVVCPIDEMGGFMAKIFAKRAGQHEAGMRPLLLSLFSKANTTYNGSEGAMEKAVPIINPNLCVYGVNTPDDLWRQFSMGQADDGFLPRWLVFDAGEERVRARDPELEITAMPDALRRRIHELLDVRPAGNLNGTLVNRPIRAEWGEGAHAMFADLQEAMDSRADFAKLGGKFAESKVVTRFAEHTIKLALLYAIGVDPRKVVITCAALEWAKAVVDASTSALVFGIEGKVADNERQAEYLWVLNRIRSAGSFGVSHRELVRETRGKWDERRHNDILNMQKSGGEIESYMGSGPSGGRPAQRWRIAVEDSEAG